MRTDVPELASDDSRLTSILERHLLSDGRFGIGARGPSHRQRARSTRRWVAVQLALRRVVVAAGRAAVGLSTSLVAARTLTLAAAATSHQREWEKERADSASNREDDASKPEPSHRLYPSVGLAAGGGVLSGVSRQRWRRGRARGRPARVQKSRFGL